MVKLPCIWKNTCICLWVQEEEGNKSDCIWVKIKDDTTVEVYYRPPCQDKVVTEVFFNEMTKLSKTYDVGLVGDFNFPNI